MDMDRNVTAFRERFKAYKNGKSISEIYDAGLPRYDIGKVPEQVSDDVIDFIIKNEGGYTGKLSIDPGNGAESLDGINVKKYIDQFKKTGRWTLQDHRNAIREIVAGNRPHIRKKLSNYKFLTKDQQKTLDDIVFNIGSLDASPEFVSAVLAGDTDKAKSEMDWGNNQKDIYGRPLRGLRTRNAARQALWGNATITPPQQQQITTVPDAVKVVPTIPQKQTVPAYDTNISPYISGKPMVRLQPRIKLPNLLDMLDDEWEPTIGFKNGKLPKYEGGKLGWTRQNGNDIKFDEETGELIDQVTGERGTMLLPEVTVTRANPKNYRSSYDPDVIRNFTDWTPVVSDIGQGLDAYNAFKNQDYLQAGLLGGALLLPNIAEKPLKYIGKAYIASMMRNPKIRNLSPTERIFAALGKNVPKDQYVGNKIGMSLMSQSPTIKHLRSQGVDTSLLSPEDLKQLLKLRKQSIQDPHLMGRRATVDTDLSQVKIFDGEVDANGDFWPIGDATFDHKPISRQNAFVSAIQDGPNKVPYSKFLDDNLRGIHMIHNYSTYPELKGVVLPRKHVAQDIYNVAIDYLRSSGKGIGLYSGKELLTPQATMRTITPKNYRMITFPDTGVWRYNNEMQVGDSWAIFEPKSQVIPYKNIELFNVNNIDNLGNFGIDWTRGSAYKNGKLPEYKDGKSPIHIKPANRGKLTRLKARTGKSESELYNDGNPAHKKMVVFARNARKWKH